MKALIQKLYKEQQLEPEEYIRLIECKEEAVNKLLQEQARTVAKEHFKNHIYTRGLIEFTNHCKNDCYYCGIRKSNLKVERYRLSEEAILACCEQGYTLGMRTFVLQGGEDRYYTDERMVTLIKKIKNYYPDCALTLSIGEQSYDTYARYFDAGVDRYLLRHETANESHYKHLHPQNLSLNQRKQCLWDLKAIGYQVGTGFMVGSPGQTVEHLVEDLQFIKQLQPHMVGIGPFLSHADTPFAQYPKGELEQTLKLISILRLMLPKALIPATTALGTLDPQGREKGILAGANVVMPNLSPIGVRKKYTLYDDKICTGEEAAEGKSALEKQMERIGYQLVSHRGDYQ